MISAAKEKMERMTNELLHIQEYTLFKNLMNEVRLFLIFFM